MGCRAHNDPTMREHQCGRTNSLARLGYEHDLEEAMMDVIVLKVAGGGLRPDVGGETCPGYVFVSNRTPPTAQILQWMSKNFEGEYSEGADVAHSTPAFIDAARSALKATRSAD